MTIPNVNVDIQDGGLGILPDVVDQVHVKIGVAAGGTENQLVSFSSVRQVQETLVSGPLADAVAFALKVGGGPVYAMRAAASTAAETTAVTDTRADSSDGTVAVTGDARDNYDAIVEVTQTGSVADGVGAFRYSLDGGDTYSAEIAITAAYEIPDTGLTLSFTDGAGATSFEEGDVFTFTATGPRMSVTDLNNSLSALLQDPREWAFVHVVGEATPAIAAAVDTYMQSAEEQKRYVFGVLEARDVADADADADGWRANLIDEWSDHASTRTTVVAGHTETLSPLTGRIHRRSGAWHLAARLASTPVHEHPGRVLSGPLIGLVELHHDEAATSGLRDQRFATLRTIVGREGFYLTDGRTRAPSGSDFQPIQNRRVMDKACRITVDAALTFLNDSVRVGDRGQIYEPDAQAIEAYISGALYGGMITPGEVSDATVRVNRDSDILATQTLYVTVSVRPLGYMSYITIDIGFVNPAREPGVALTR